MELPEGTKLNSGSSTSNPSSEDYGMKVVDTQTKIMVSDEVNGLQCKTENSDSFVVDMEGFSNGINKDTTSNSRITLQRSLSRKGSQRSGEKKTNSVVTVDADAIPATLSPRAALVGGSTLEKPVAVVVTAAAAGTTDHHHIAITGGNIGPITEGRCISRRYSFRRASPSWLIDPRRILFFFATLSSMGTILLIYFALSIKRLGEDDNELNWQH